MDNPPRNRAVPATSVRKPRVGFLGTGGIGHHRMAAICATGAVEPAAFWDPSDDAANFAGLLAPAAQRVSSLDAMLELGLDGIVIATPGAGHAAQCRAALRCGAAVFCSAPLGRCEAEAAAVVEAAQAADRLLAVDFACRGSAAAQALKAEVESGRLGSIFAVDLAFHKHGAPDQPWLYDRTLSGGGCVIDLGTHLIDLALWVLGAPEIAAVDARLHAGGALARPDQAEDYATVQIALTNDTSVRIACSWRLDTAAETELAAVIHGTRASAGMHNAAGGFTEFTAFKNLGTGRITLGSHPEVAAGGMAAAWARRLATDRSYDPAADAIIAVAGAVERIYRSGFSQGSDGRRYQSTEPFPRPLLPTGQPTAAPQSRPRGANA